MAKRRSSTDRFISQAAAQALVRYGPELSGLTELLRQAGSTRQQSIASAKGTAQTTQAAVASALPFIAQVYGKAGTGASQAGTLLSHDLAGLGPAADYLKGAGAVEQAAGIDRINAARAFAQSTLADRAVRAAEGAQSGVRAANQQYVSDVTGINNRKQALANEMGAFQAATVGDLLETRTKYNHELAQQLRQQNFQAGQNAANRKNQADIAAGHDATSLQNTQTRTQAQARKNAAGALPGGAKPLSAKDHAKTRDALDEAQTWIQRLSASQHMSEHDIRAHLEAGDTLVDGNGNKLKLPKIPKDVVNTAYDVQAFGGVSQANVKALHRRGLTLKGLGLKPVGKRKRAAKQTFASNPFTKPLRG